MFAAKISGSDDVNLDVVINGKFYRRGIIESGAIGIKDGRIVSIKKDLKGDKNYDVKGLILPAGMDAHVHFREPGSTYKEDFSSGTLSALFGGITTVLDMPNNNPAPVTSTLLSQKDALVSRKAWIDYGLFGGISYESDIEVMAKMVPAFKLYMGPTTGAVPCIRREDMPELMRRIMESGSILSVHAEDADCLNYHDEKIRANAGEDWGENSLKDHARHRPVECETRAVERVLNIFYRTDLLKKGGHLHICHVSSPDLMNSVERYRSGYHRLVEFGSVKNDRFVTTEVTPHHLLLDYDCKGGTECKVNPPLRDANNRENLLLLLRTSMIDMVASDHAPHTIKDKDTDFDSAPAGIPGTETMYPLLMKAYADGHLRLKRVVDSLSTLPARYYGALGKGMIGEGYFADLTAFDIHKTRVIKGKELHSKAGWTPYEGREAIFPEMVFVRGELMIRQTGDSNNRARSEIVGERAGKNIYRARKD